MRACVLSAHPITVARGSVIVGTHTFSSRIGVAFELLNALQRSSLEPGRVTGDRRLAGSLDLWHSAIKRRNQLEEFTYGADRCHRQRDVPYRFAGVRDAFQTSPQRVHRQ